MKISSLLIVIFLISGFVSGFTLFYGALMNANDLSIYDFNTSANTSQTMSTIESIYNITEASQNTTAVSTSTGFTGPENIITGGYNVIMQVVNLPIFFGGLITDLTSKIFGLPIWATTMFYGIITILIIAAIMTAILGVNRF